MLQDIYSGSFSWLWILFYGCKSPCLLGLILQNFIKWYFKKREVNFLGKFNDFNTPPVKSFEYQKKVGTCEKDFVRFMH